MAQRLQYIAFVTSCSRVPWVFLVFRGFTSFDIRIAYVHVKVSISQNFSLQLNIAKMSNTERTFIMIKPDGVHRGLVGEIIKRFEQKGYKLVAMKFEQVKKLVAMKFEQVV